MPIVESAMALGKYLVCPEVSKSSPDISEPMHNPDRANNVVRWVPELFSFELPNGGTFFCDLLQNGDPSEPWANNSESNIDDEWFVDGEINETE